MAKNTNPAAGKALTFTRVLTAAIDDLLGLHIRTQKTLKNLQKAVPMRKLTEAEKKAIKEYEAGLQKTLDIIAPAGFELKTNDLILNDLHARVLYTYNWPNYIYPGWLGELVNFDAHMTISQFIYPADNKAVMKLLRKKVTEMRSSVRMLEQRGIVRDPAIEAALQDAEELRDLLARGREKLYQLGLYITLYSSDKEKLKKLQTDVESLLGGKLVLTKPAFMQMEHGWISTLPFGIDELEINRNMNTSPVAACFPFSSSDLTDDHGILYGINRHNDSLVIFDRFDLPNANSNVFATSGAGKSFAVKLELLRSMMFGTEVYVIDPENEYRELCETVGGTFVPISLQSSFSINPFDLPKAVRGEEAGVGEVLRAAAINLHGLFKLMLGTLTPAEDGILDKAILDTYALKDIHLNTPNPGDKEPPTMHDLVDVLSTTEGGENMARTLSKYTEGSYAGLFNKQTNVNIDDIMVVFQIRDLEDQLRPIAMYIVINLIWNRIRAELKRRLLVIDEAWNLIQHEDSARFLYGLIKRARKYYLGVTTITQDVEDFVNSPYGKPIITNASLQVLLKQSPSAVDNLQKIFYLTEGEKYLLLNSDVGQGIFFAGNRHVAIQIVASPKETDIITTNPEEVLAKRALKNLTDMNQTPDEQDEHAAMVAAMDNLEKLETESDQDTMFDPSRKSEVVDEEMEKVKESDTKEAEETEEAQEAEETTVSSDPEDSSDSSGSSESSDSSPEPSIEELSNAILQQATPPSKKEAEEADDSEEAEEENEEKNDE